MDKQNQGDKVTGRPLANSRVREGLLQSQHVQAMVRHHSFSSLPSSSPALKGVGRIVSLLNKLREFLQKLP